MKQPSQCARVLAVLNDGQWHRMEEIHARAGFMRLNSRVSDLRNQGHIIECDKSGRVYRYRLLGTLPDELLPLPSTSPALQSAPGPQHLSLEVGTSTTEDGRSVGEVPLFETNASTAPEWA